MHDGQMMMMVHLRVQLQPVFDIFFTLECVADSLKAAPVGILNLFVPVSPEAVEKRGQRGFKCGGVGGQARCNMVATPLPGGRCGCH